LSNACSGCVAWGATHGLGASFDTSPASAFRTSDWGRPNCRALCDGLTPAVKAALTFNLQGSNEQHPDSRITLTPLHSQDVRVHWAEYCKMMQAMELDLPQADDIRINEPGPVTRVAGSEIELVPMTFSFPPVRPGGVPVFLISGWGNPQHHGGVGGGRLADLPDCFRLPLFSSVLSPDPSPRLRASVLRTDAFSSAMRISISSVETSMRS
jgi:hypothetical protein